jgi:hypothetical protein
MAQTDEAVVVSPNPVLIMTVVKKPALALALVMVSSVQPTSSAIVHASSSLHLEEDMVLQFDATHCISELTASWGKLVVVVASFGE